MNKLVLIIILFSSSETFAQTWKKITTTPALVGTAGSVLQANQCPTGYLLIPKNTLYTPVDFCVMKYEAKKDTYGTAVSVAAGVPWLNITRTVARDHCKALGAGYDMISNDQWQTIARNIAGVAANWSTGVLNSGSLNTGLSDGNPSAAKAAVTDDNNSCSAATGQTCSATVWDKQRRTHQLSNGNVIWDFAGNVWEFVTNNNTASNGAITFISEVTSGYRQIRYGATAFCATPSTTPYCGMGLGNFAIVAGGAIIRGGDHSSDEDAGVFATYMADGPATSGDYIGFRCVYVP